MIVSQLIQQAAKSLNEFDTAVLDAQLLLAHVLEKDRTWLYTWSDSVVINDHHQTFQQLVERRIQGEPIAHILGSREFWNLTLECNASTLIPRPETEHLVEAALELDLSKCAKVLDLGTGTGAIALALASEKSDWVVEAVDFSAQAVALAERNALKNDIANVTFYQSNWFQAVEKSVSFDLIVSNPPYVDSKSECLSEGDVRFEPKTALIADNSGMADIEYIIANAPNYMNPKGWLALEHGFDQEQRVQKCFDQNKYTNIKTDRDLAGLSRITYAQYLPIGSI